MTAAFERRSVAYAALGVLAVLQAHRMLAGVPSAWWPAGNDFHPLVGNTWLQLHGGWLWTHLVGGGHPLYANPLSSLWYLPVTVPVALLGPGPGLVVAVVLHLWLAGVAFHGFVGRFTSVAGLRFLGAAIFLLSGAFAARASAGHLNILVPLAWTPLALHFLLDVARGGGRRGVAGAAAVIAVMGLVDFQMALFLGIVVVALMVSEGFQWARLPTLPSPRWGILGDLAAVPALAAILAGLKLVPVALFTARVGRDVEPLTGSVSLAEQLTWFVLNHRGPVVSNAFHEYYVYLGVLVVALAALGALTSESSKRPLFAGLVALIAWAQGFHTPLAVFHEIPGLDLIRNPQRALLVAVPMVAVLATLGLAELPRLTARARLGTALVLRRGLAAVMVLQSLELLMPPLLYVAMRERFEWFAARTYLDVTPFDVAAAAAAAAIGWTAFPRAGLLRSDRVTRALPAFILFTLVVVNGSLFGLAEGPGERDVAERVGDIVGGAEYAVVDAGVATPHIDFAMAGIPLLVGEYAVSGEWHDAASPRAYDSGGTSLRFGDYVVLQAPDDAADRTLVGEVVTEAADTVYIYREDSAAPAAFVLRNATVVPIDVASFAAGRIVLDAPSLVVGERIIVKQSFYPGWRTDAHGLAVLDDQRWLALVATSTFEGGKITLTFRPPDLAWGAGLTAVGIIAAGVLAGSPASRRSPRGRRQPEARSKE